MLRLAQGRENFSLMAIENQPKFNAWNEAFERRNRAEREYLEARMLGRSQGEIDAAELELGRALAAYKLIVDNLDEGDDASQS